MALSDEFVGRERELALLTEELDRARSGEPRLVWLTGEAGMGKTSLLRRFVHQATGVELLWASGDETEMNVAYGIFDQLLGQLTAGAASAWSRFERIDHETNPLQVGASLLSGLGALQEAGPVVLVVDDALWADSPSAQALVFVLRRLRSDRVLVVLTARSDASASWGEQWERALAQPQLTRRVSLGGLTADDLRRLAPKVDGVQLSPAAGRRLFEHTGGHPMYARALLEELPAEAFLESSGVLPAPRSLASLWLVRLAKLSVDAQQLTLAAAVLGARCALPDAVVVADVADPVAALDEAVRAGLLVQGPPGSLHDIGFRHVLVRSAVYSDLSPARRHDLHQKAAAVLAGTAALAHRVAAAVAPDATLALELEGLARADASRQDWRSAADHWTTAAQLTPTAADRNLRLVSSAVAMLSGGEIARAVRLAPAVRAAPPSAARSRVLGQIAVFEGAFATARAELTAALDSPQEQLEPPDVAVVSAHLGLLAILEGNVEGAADLSLEALMGAPDAQTTAIAKFVVLMGLAAQGRQAELLELLDVLGGAGEASAALTPDRAAVEGLLALWASREAEAAATLSDVLRRQSPSLLMQGRILLLGCLAEARYRLGDWDAAVVDAELAISLAQDAGIVLANGIIHAIASLVASGRGLWESAEARVAVAVAAAQALPWWASRAYAATARATLAQARGDHVAMLSALKACAEPGVQSHLDGLGTTAWRALLVESLVGLGRLSEAESALSELEARVAGGVPGWVASEAARLRARLVEIGGDPTAARQAYERALRLTGGTPASFSRARLEMAYGRFLLEQGDRRNAFDMLRSARDSLQRLQARPFLAVCDELLHNAGLRAPRQGDPLGLTAQEVAVARLVAAGRTNSEAGLELFITSRTVAFHLSNIYAKAGIESRRHLAERFPDLLV